MYLWQGDDQQALKAYQQSENLYREIGDRAALPGALCSIGEIFIALCDFSRAQKYFEEGHTLAQSVHVTRWQGRNLWGLAQLQEKMENRSDAIGLGGQALRILEQANHRDMHLVRIWLNSITDTYTG
jgi:tetratricopeptide (TPR) repeat protein